MSSIGPFSQRILIVVFALGIVLIGSQELRRRHRANGSGTVGPEMVKALHGEFDVKSADIAERAKAQHERATLDEIQGGQEDLNSLKKLLDTLAP